MIVEGYRVPEEVVQAANKKIVELEQFEFFDIQKFLEQSGIPRDNTYRITDRLLQKAKKAGKIRFTGLHWVKV